MVEKNTPMSETPEPEETAPAIPDAAGYLAPTPVRFHVEYMLSQAQYLDFNRFILEQTGTLRRSRSRMKYLGIAALIAALVVLVAALVMQRTDATFFFAAGVLLVCGVLSMVYYPYIFPKQFARSIDKSYAESGYSGRTLSIDFHDEGLVETSEEPVGALYEDVEGLFETPELILLLMERQQAVVVPKSAVGERQAEFVGFVSARVPSDDKK